LQYNGSDVPIQRLKQRRADIYLPKFKYEAAYSLKQTLTNMGMKQAFNESADFSGLSDSAAEPVYLGMFQHKAFVEVNETSTEAAAATASGALFGGPPKIPFIPEFRADHPFLYIIRDVVSGSVLFVGRMTTP
jgi:serpin B